MMTDASTVSISRIKRLFPECLTLTRSGSIVSVKGAFTASILEPQGKHLDEIFVCSPALHPELFEDGMEIRLAFRGAAPERVATFHVLTTDDGELWLLVCPTKYEFVPATKSESRPQEQIGGNRVELDDPTDELATLAEYVDVALLIERNDHSISLANKALYRLFGIDSTTTQLIGSPMCAFVGIVAPITTNPDGFENRVADWWANSAGAKEECVNLSDGRIISITCRPVHKLGAQVCRLWAINDITAQNTTHKQIAAQRDYYEKILNAIPIDLVIAGRDLRFSFVNKTAIKDEQRRKWAIGKNNAEYCATRNFPPEIGENRDKRLQQVVDTKGPVVSIEEFVKPDGSVQYVQRGMYPFIDGDHTTEFIIIYGTDITEEVKSKQYAEVQEKRIQNFLDIINDGVFRCDENGNLNLYNNAFLKIMDLEIEPGMNRNINFFDLLPESEWYKLQQQLYTLYIEKTWQTGMLTLRQPDGTKKYVDYLLTSAMRKEDAAFVGRISDITDQINKEKHLNEIINKEKNLNYSKSGFIKITSHELRTPLSIIRANAEILEMALEKGMSLTQGAVDGKRLLGRINKEVMIMTEILSRLLMVSRIEEGSIEPEFSVLDIAAFLSELKHDYFAPYTDGRQLQLQMHSNMEPVYTDKNLLKHAILNLVNNAFKYSPGKKPPILEATQHQGKITIAIKDFGIGIPETEIENLFKSFFRASNVRNIQGTGLGLTVVEYVIKKLKGDISLHTNQPEGMVFAIELPLR